MPAAEQLVAALRANGELERLRSLALEKLEKDVGWAGRKQPRLPCALARRRRFCRRFCLRSKVAQRLLTVCHVTSLPWPGGPIAPNRG